jgi:cell wall-associated NlpC family hydrolase
LIDLLTAPDGLRDRQLLVGDGFCVIEDRAEMSFGFARKDSYCGWLPTKSLVAETPKTHFVASPGTHLYPTPRVQDPEIMALFMNARVAVESIDGAWAKLPGGFVPLCHLRALGDVAADPVAVAETLLGTPYLWGGNSRAGLDCSGLVQAAYLACAIPCPADSDQQARAGVEAIGPSQRGDLIFWRGHVAMVVDAKRLIHANAHHMAVAVEEIGTASNRIAQAGGGPVTARRRLLG